MRNTSKKALSLVVGLSLSMAQLPVWSQAAEAKPSASQAPAEATADSANQTAEAKSTFQNVSEDGGKNQISLSQPRSFEVSLLLDLSEKEAKNIASKVTWSLAYQEDAGYLDAEQYPHHTKGGALDTWKAMNQEALFSQPETSVEVKDGKVYLKTNFESKLYFYTSSEDGAYVPDYSVPHVNGGFYMDLCGFYDLTASVEGEVLGSIPVKIAPYDNFHTMKEIYADIDEMVSYAAENTDLYVEKFSMGQSQGDNGLPALDMPYLIVAKDRKAVNNWKKIKAEAEQNPSGLIEKIEKGTLEDYQVPVLYSNVHSNEVAATDGVLKFAWMLLEAAADDGKLSYDKLTGFTAEGKAELQKQMGPVGEKNSVAIPDLVKGTASYLGYIKPQGSDISGWVNLKKYYTMENVTVDLDDLLDDVFFLLVPEENVEGRTYLTRTSSGGFDLNRDNSFQTQAETQNMTHLIAQWNPVSYAEFHGRVKQFQCEPCDPPHEPNFEYDLLAEHLVTGGEALGIAAVANNSSYNSYVIPQRDYLSYTGEKTADGQDQTCWYDPWDDMSTSYTPQYAMLHGTVAYTVEVPAYNDATATAVAYGQLGQSNYIAENKKDYLLAQTKIFERGVTNANSDAYDQVGQWFCDQYDVEGAEADLFRPEYDGEGQNGNFYPECYLIPFEGTQNRQAVVEMMEYLTRNGVKIRETNQEITYNGVKYPKGTFVVPMYQAKRSVANGVLYDGTVITHWPVLYSEGITAFNKTRGFDMTVCAEPDAYQEIIAACGPEMDEKGFQEFLNEPYYQTYPYLSGLSGETGFAGPENFHILLLNNSEDAVAAVNALLKDRKEVSLITEGQYKGSFLLNDKDWWTVTHDYILSGIGTTDIFASRVLTKAPVVYISGKPAANTAGFTKAALVSGAYEYNYDRQAMEILGFETTENAEEADLIIGAAALDDAALKAIKSGTLYIGYGRRAIPGAQTLFPEGALVRNTVSSESMDALAYVTYPNESLINASYIAEGDSILYGYGAGYFASIPEGAQVLVQLDGSKELLEGFLCEDGEHYEDFLNDSIQAISYQGKSVDGDDIDVVLFANTLTNKIHQRDEFGFIANAAFATVVEKEEKPEAKPNYIDVPSDMWYAEPIAKITELGFMPGTAETTFEPESTLTRGMFVQALYNMAGQPEVQQKSDFIDVAADAPYAKAVDWAVEKGIAFGTGDNCFDPDKGLTREQTVSMLYRYAGSPTLNQNEANSLKERIGSYTDANEISLFAQDAMQWALIHNIVSGTAQNSLSPGRTASRAEMAAFLLRLYESGKAGF